MTGEINRYPAIMLRERSERRKRLVAFCCCTSIHFPSARFGGDEGSTRPRVWVGQPLLKRDDRARFDITQPTLAEWLEGTAFLQVFSFERCLPALAASTARKEDLKENRALLHCLVRLIQHGLRLGEHIRRERILDRRLADPHRV